MFLALSMKMAYFLLHNLVSEPAIKIKSSEEENDAAKRYPSNVSVGP
jgi:hypothetical protein